jgi:hypothetical protein
MSSNSSLSNLRISKVIKIFCINVCNFSLFFAGMDGGGGGGE